MKIHENFKQQDYGYFDALFLMLAITAALVVLPVANAHDPPWTIRTYAYVACAPNTVGNARE
jgi:hypothetical protein